MVDYNEVEKFISYVIADEDADDFNEALPYGGLKKDAPDEAVTAYKAYCKAQDNAEKQGIKR